MSTRSEIFDNFIKIAKEKGLVSNSEAEHTEQNTKNPRWDSLDISDIGALYNVKPDQSKNMDYDHNIMEIAHPNSVVIAPSYDKLNGLVENDIERQNILMHILYKEPESGSPNQGMYPMRPTLLYPTPKYAEKDLIMSLVRVANDMDNKKQDQLRILADVCLNQMHQGFHKRALLPLLIGIASLLGVIYLQQHLDDADQGLGPNYVRLQDELSDLMSADITLGVGHQYDNQLKQDVADLQARLGKFWENYEKILPLIRNLEKPKDAQETIQLAQTPQAQTVMQAYQDLRKEAFDLYTYLDATEKNFSNPDYKAEHTQKGGVTSVIDSIPFLHGGKTSLTADDFDDVINAIPPFRASVKRLLDTLASAHDFATKIQADLSSSQSKTQSELGRDAFTTPPSASKGKTVQDIDNETSTLNKMFEGIKDFVPGLGQ